MNFSLQDYRVLQIKPASCQDNALGNGEPILAPAFQPDVFWGMLNK